MSTDELCVVNPSTQEKYRCFSKSAGMTIEATTRKAEPKGPTINIDIAPRRNNSINWKDKITVQLSDTELPVFAAVCLGFLPSCKIARPGKGLEVIRQEGKLYFRASAGKGCLYALPAQIGEAFNICTLVLRQLEQQTLIHDGQLLLAALRGSAALYKSEK